MGLEELVARLERDARDRVTAIDASAQERIAAIEAESELMSSRHRTVALAALRAERRKRIDAELSVAHARARAVLLEARHALVERVMARALALVRETGRAAYAPAISAHLERALRFAPDDAIVRCPPELAAGVRAALADHPRIALEEVEMPIGLVVVARDGSMEVDATMVALLERARTALAIRVVRECAR